MCLEEKREGRMCLTDAAFFVCLVFTISKRFGKWHVTITRVAELRMLNFINVQTKTHFVCFCLLAFAMVIDCGIVYDCFAKFEALLGALTGHMFAQSEEFYLVLPLAFLQSSTLMWTSRSPRTLCTSLYESSLIF